MTSVSTLGIALTQISNIKGQQSLFDELSTQLSTGKKTQRLSGLGSDVAVSQRARADASSIDTYLGNITKAGTRIELMASSLQEIQNQADVILDALNSSLEQGSYEDLDSIQSITEEAYNFILELVNSKDGNRYLFAGADYESKPITDNGLFEGFLGEFVPDETDLTSSPLVASGAIGDWGDGTIDNDTFISTYRATSEIVLGYSNSLTNDTAGKVSTRIDDNLEVDYTVLGDNDAIKDIVIAMGVLKELPPVEYAPGALNSPTATTFAEDTQPYPPTAKQENFFAIISDLKSMLHDASEELNTEIQELSLSHAHVTRIEESLNVEQATLSNIVSEVEDVDVNEVAVKITQLQTQLSTSYQVTAMISELSLANFL
jgi:flagellar hook-associated protein 3 FlgL